MCYVIKVLYMKRSKGNFLQKNLKKKKNTIVTDFLYQVEQIKTRDLCPNICDEAQLGVFFQGWTVS